VFYRASTQEVASRLSITGYARNLPDRRVEVLACGDDAALREFEAWLWEGPRYAEVAGVVCSPVTIDQIPTSFSTE